METLAVCDTEPIAIEGLRSLLKSVEGLRVVASETSLPHAMDLVRELKPSLFVVGMSFGMQTVLTLLENLRQSESPTHVIVWSTAVSDGQALRLISRGAAGVIRKSAPLKTLLACMQAVASGNTWVEDEMAGEADHPLPSRYALTARERQVMELVERGLRNSDIGVELGICTGTVKIHLKHIFEKTGSRGRYELVVLGLKEKGLLALSTVDGSLTVLDRDVTKPVLN